MSKKTLAILAACCALPALIVFGPLVMVGMLIAGSSPNNTTNASAISRCTLDPISATTGSTGTGTLEDEQLANAKAIIAVGKQLDIPARGWVIALATALQESGLRNLDYGDRDSLGLFQQRPSAGWGTPEQITTPEYAARAFYGGPSSPTDNTGLLSIDGWQHKPVWEAAQAVQRSAFPMAYAQHEKLATSLVKKLAGQNAGCEPLQAGAWTLPINGDYQLTSRYGGRTSPTQGTADFHTGLDFAVPLGTRVRAVTSGTVVSAGPSGTGYGNLIRIRHTDGVESWYAHLSTVSVAEGKKVRSGQAIGAVGSTGNSTGPHLHLEIRLDDQPTNPDDWLQKKGLEP